MLVRKYRKASLPATAANSAEEPPSTFAAAQRHRSDNVDKQLAPGRQLRLPLWMSRLRSLLRKTAAVTVDGIIPVWPGGAHSPESHSDADAESPTAKRGARNDGGILWPAGSSFAAFRH